MTEWWEWAIRPTVCTTMETRCWVRRVRFTGGGGYDEWCPDVGSVIVARASYAVITALQETK